MSKIRSKNTGAEILIFKELGKRKISFSKHYKKVVGSPDIAVPKKKKAVFIDGDFWHGYQFSKLKRRLPKKYWFKKIENNIKRDKRIRSKLKRQCWKVLRLWEHKINKNPERAVNKITKFLK